ncbi:MAG: MlaE family lipid ABC transporter permease subunit [Phycisphaerales bacterium]
MGQPQTAIIKLEGRVDGAWLQQQSGAVLQQALLQPPRQLVIDLAAVTAMDSTAAGVIGVLQRRIQAQGGACTLEGANDAVGSLLRTIAAAKAAPAEPPRDGYLAALGRSAAERWESAQTNLYYFGRCLVAVPWGFMHLRQVRWVDWVRSAANSGMDAMGVNLLLGFIIGWIIAYEVLPPMQQYGAGSMVPNVMGVAIVRELGPLITAILIAGRSGSAFAAELGTMKVTQELDAYTTFGIDPVRYLVAPRILALMFTMPLLSWFTSLAGLMGGYVVLRTQVNMSLTLYFQDVKDSIDVSAFLFATLKVVVFGFIVASVGCISGLRTKEGPSAVGDATTRAVVMSIVFLIVADGVFSALFYALDI